MARWYAVLADREDTDCGTGSHSKGEAMRMCRELNDCMEQDGFGRDAFIVALDGTEQIAEYDEDGMMI